MTKFDDMRSKAQDKLYDLEADADKTLGSVQELWSSSATARIAAVCVLVAFIVLLLALMSAL